LDGSIFSFGEFSDCGPKKKHTMKIEQRVFINKKTHKSHHILTEKKLEVTIFKQGVLKGLEN